MAEIHLRVEIQNTMYSRIKKCRPKSPKEKIMKNISKFMLAAILLSTFLFNGSARNVSAKEQKIMEFNTMVGVPQALTGINSQAPLRGINGGGIPWMISSGSG